MFRTKFYHDMLFSFISHKKISLSTIIVLMFSSISIKPSLRLIIYDRQVGEPSEIVHQVQRSQVHALDVQGEINLICSV